MLSDARLVAIGLVLLCSGGVQGRGSFGKPNSTYQHLRPLRQYSGRVEAGRGGLPTHCITDERRWGEVWLKMCGEALRPEVDFKTELLMIGIIDGANSFTLEGFVNDQEDLYVEFMGTLIGYGEPTEGHYIAKAIPRVGIKSVDGKPLKAGIVRELSDGPEVKSPAVSRLNLLVHPFRHSPYANLAANPLPFAGCGDSG